MILTPGDRPDTHSMPRTHPQPRIDTHCDSGGSGSGSGSVCEDLIQTIEGAEGAAWVLDGTSGFSDRSFTDAVSDGRWYVETLDSALRSHINDGDSIAIPVKKAIIEVTRRFVQEIPDAHNSDSDSASAIHPARHELPACTVSLLRWNHQQVEYLNLCDASLLYQLSDGSVERITTPGVLQKVDTRIQRLRHLAQSPESSVTASDVESYIRQTRQHANTPGGYWVAQQNPIAALFATTGVIDRSRSETIVLHSDGVDPIVELHEEFSQWSDMLSFATAEGADAVIGALRQAEAEAEAEAEATTETAQPQVRTGDDAAIAVVEF